MFVPNAGFYAAFLMLFLSISFSLLQAQSFPDVYRALHTTQNSLSQL